MVRQKGDRMVELVMKWAEGADRDLGLPQYQSLGAAGADLQANLPDRGTLTLAPLARYAVPTGLHMQIPQGYEVQIRPRSGLALRHGITMINAPGTIDSDYRGQVFASLINLSEDPFVVTHGDRIAQMIIAPVVQAQFTIAAELDDTERGQSGFGSTGIAK